MRTRIYVEEPALDEALCAAPGGPVYRIGRSRGASRATLRAGPTNGNEPTMNRMRMIERGGSVTYQSGREIRSLARGFAAWRQRYAEGQTTASDASGGGLHEELGVAN